MARTRGAHGNAAVMEGFSKLLRRIRKFVWHRDRYEPAAHYMRGPGPKSLAKRLPGESKGSSSGVG